MAHHRNSLISLWLLGWERKMGNIWFGRSIFSLPENLSHSILERTDHTTNQTSSVTSFSIHFYPLGIFLGSTIYISTLYLLLIFLMEPILPWITRNFNSMQTNGPESCLPCITETLLRMSLARSSLRLCSSFQKAIN